jgi:hypothetical protein
VHELGNPDTVMATFNRLPSGYWRAQVRRKGQHASRSFRLESETEAWAVDAERAVHRGKPPNAFTADDKTSFASLIELHIKDLAEVGKPLLRSKALCLEKLKRDLGRERLSALTRERLIAGRSHGQRYRDGTGWLGGEVEEHLDEAKVLDVAIRARRPFEI